MAQAVDCAIRCFPTVLDMLGATRVSAMDGCNLADTMMDEVFRLVRVRSILSGLYIHALRLIDLSLSLSLSLIAGT